MGTDFDRNTLAGRLRIARSWMLPLINRRMGIAERDCAAVGDAIAEIDRLTAENKALKDTAAALCAWVKKYPSSRIYSEGQIRIIAKEIDEIAAQAKAALALREQGK